MKIVVDARCLMDGRKTGVEEYTLNLLLNLFEIDKNNQYVLFFNSFRRPIFDFSIFEKFSNVELRCCRIPNKLLNFCFWYLGWPKIDKLAGGADLVFMPNIIFGAVSSGVRLVVTMHDLSFEHHPEYFSFKRRWWHLFINPKKICARADKIVCVSQSTKDDVTNLFEVEEKKVCAIASAVSEDFRIIDRNEVRLIEVKEKYKLPYRFILYLGTIEPRKNILSVIRAYERFLKEAMAQKNENLSRYNLVIAGSSGWLNQEIFSAIKNSFFRWHIHTADFIDDADKPYVYNLASLFVYPSFFEGFGFPPLEAMKCGVPVIVSNNSSLPEIVGNSGIMIDPDKPEEIMRATREILVNKELKENLVKKGLEKSREFDWKKTAEKTLAVFNAKI